MCNNPKYIAEAASHEVGHNLSLTHDGTTVGQGARARRDRLLLRPRHVGADHGRRLLPPVSQWSQGEYQNANNAGQDDLAADRRPGAVRRRTRPAAPSVRRPAALPATAAIITTRTDVDVFRLGTCSGTVSLTRRPGAEQPEPRHPARAGRRERRRRRAGRPRRRPGSATTSRAAWTPPSRPRSPRASTTHASTASGSATRSTPATPTTRASAPTRSPRPGASAAAAVRRASRR